MAFFKRHRRARSEANPNLSKPHNIQPFTSRGSRRAGSDLAGLTKAEKDQLTNVLLSLSSAHLRGLCLANSVPCSGSREQQATLLIDIIGGHNGVESKSVQTREHLLREFSMTYAVRSPMEDDMKSETKLNSHEQNQGSNPEEPSHHKMLGFFRSSSKSSLAQDEAQTLPHKV